MSDFRLESHPAAESYRLLDFESVEVNGGFAGGYFLTVRGIKPCLNMHVTLSPRIYIRCPEFWGIEVVGHLPQGICLPAIGRYDETIELTGITGSNGIEVIGARRTETVEVPGGCSSSDGFSPTTPDIKPSLCIVVALTATPGDKNEGCQVIRDGDPYLAIYSRVFGPAPRDECAAWVKENCGFAGGDPRE